MTTNRLVKSEAYVPKLTAAEYAAIAREDGNFEKAKLWDAEAEKRGEERIPNGIMVRFNQDGSTRRVYLR